MGYFRFLNGEIRLINGDKFKQKKIYKMFNLQGLQYTNIAIKRP